MTAFTTFTDAVEFAETILGEFASDFDVDGFASELWGAQVDGTDLGEDDVWHIAEKYDLGIRADTARGAPPSSPPSQTQASNREGYDHEEDHQGQEVRHRHG